MSLVVVLAYTDAQGVSHQWRENSAATHPADAICRAFDNMEASGIDIDSLRVISGIAAPIPARAASPALTISATCPAVRTLQ